MTAEELRRQLAFYRDLGIKEIYRRLATESPVLAEKASVIETVTSLEIPAVSSIAPRLPDQTVHPVHAVQPQAKVKPLETEVVSMKEQDRPVPVAISQPNISAGSMELPQVPQTVKQSSSFELPPLHPVGDSMLQIRQDIGENCRRCRLCEGRTNLVFGSGNEKSPLVFVGEGPGADEDEQGLPFVGRAGQLLTQMINNTTEKEGIPIKREDVYICNVVKCRPPGNRAPQPDEMEICGQFLSRQLSVIQPKAIVTLGATASKALLDMKEGITKARGKWHKWRDVPVMVTYHPSYLLRNQSKELRREVWEDLKAVFHFVYDK